MGRRSRKRADTADVASRRVETRAPASAPPAPSTPRLRARIEDAPKAPWHPFPLVELAVLVGIVLIVLAFAIGGDGRAALLFGGLALVSVAALELAIREHFAGYRSHTTLLAAVCAVGAAAGLYPTSLPQEVLLVVGVTVGAISFKLLRDAFARRARGLKFRA